MKTKIYSYITSILVGGTLLGFSSCIDEDINWAKKNALLEPVALIYEVKAAYAEMGNKDLKMKPDVLNGLTKTTGVVISDISGNNIPKNHMIIQATDPKSTLPTTQRSLALILQLDDAADNIYVHGDSVVVDLDGTVLKNIDGNIVLTGVTLEKIMRVKTQVIVNPITLTSKDLYLNFERYANMFVQVDSQFDKMPAEGEVLKGSKGLTTREDALVYLRTDEGADFANKEMPISGEYTGITYWDGDKKELRMQTSNDIRNEAGPLYNNWPEDFEQPSIKELGLMDEGGVIPKSLTSYNYADNFGFFNTGKWLLYFCILVDPELSATQGRDRVSGEQGIRIQQKMSTQENPYYGKQAMLEMMFDVPDGASKITYTYGSYYNDAKSTFVLEYSTDQGSTWKEAHKPVSTPDKFMQVQTAILDIKDPVRFRIKKGLNTAADGRLSIDNFYIYKGVW